ncbi:hypothetical protein HYH03_014037 [Edaphochlamys debaryana]|uniref:Uncharacterized protein n=1 Tax=Edaphochlamys debaryana TaxID=47281 RepID=A0A835XPL8_9CHLO|nr:hypothetical protein HYH03_014037 [Edaphochlamys debaryana]|eukprot:KAG2487320.1 hypothetical protein HYH03_014037 [Edaphochlamys debaryana]
MEPSDTCNGGGALGGGGGGGGVLGLSNHRGELAADGGSLAACSRQAACGPPSAGGRADSSGTGGGGVGSASSGSAGGGGLGNGRRSGSVLLEFDAAALESSGGFDMSGRAGELVALGRELSASLEDIRRRKTQLAKQELLVAQEIAGLRRALLEELQRQRHLGRLREQAQLQPHRPEQWERRGTRSDSDALHERPAETRGAGRVTSEPSGDHDEGRPGSSVALSDHSQSPPERDGPPSPTTGPLPLLGSDLPYNGAAAHARRAGAGAAARAGGGAGAACGGSPRPCPRQASSPSLRGPAAPPPPAPAHRLAPGPAQLPPGSQPPSPTLRDQALREPPQRRPSFHPSDRVGPGPSPLVASSALQHWVVPRGAQPHQLSSHPARHLNLHADGPNDQPTNLHAPPNHHVAPPPQARTELRNEVQDEIQRQLLQLVQHQIDLKRPREAQIVLEVLKERAGLTSTADPPQRAPSDSGAAAVVTTAAADAARTDVGAGAVAGVGPGAGGGKPAVALEPPPGHLALRRALSRRASRRDVRLAVVVEEEPPGAPAPPPQVLVPGLPVLQPRGPPVDPLPLNLPGPDLPAPELLAERPGLVAAPCGAHDLEPAAHGVIEVVDNTSLPLPIDVSRFQGLSAASPKSRARAAPEEDEDIRGALSLLVAAEVLAAAKESAEPKSGGDRRASDGAEGEAEEAAKRPRLA